MNVYNEQPTSAYGISATPLLSPSGVRGALGSVARGFVAHLHESLRKKEGCGKTLRRLTEFKPRALRLLQVRYLRSLLAPALSEKDHHAIAVECGKRLALLGIDPASVIRETREYAEALRKQIMTLPLERHIAEALASLVAVRANTEIHANLLGMNVLHQERQSFMGKLMQRPSHSSEHGDWTQTVLDGLMNLCGFRAAAIARPDPEGTFIFDSMTGDFDRYLEAMLSNGIVPCAQDRQSVLSRGPIGRCWHTGVITTVTAYENEPSAAPWKHAARSLGFRSGASIPLKDIAGRMLGVLTIYGRYPGMFEPTEMRTFLELLGVLLSHAIGLRRHFTGSRVPVPARQSRFLRQCVYSGDVKFLGQPIVDLKACRPIGVEFLARLRDARGKIISPGEFLPLYGHEDLVRLFKLGLSRALAQARRWDENGFSIDVSINLPPELLSEPSCAEWVAAELDRHALAPERLKLELLEDGPYGEKAQHDASIQALASLGVCLAMDDLGSGYSSLLRLSTLPFDLVKVDQGLVRGADDDPQKVVGLIGSLIDLGKGLDLSVVVEGLESVDLVEAAAVLGADAGQGYALARPMPVDEIVDWSRQFSLKINPTEPQTRLGRLAAIWRSEHAKRR